MNSIYGRPLAGMLLLSAMVLTLNCLESFSTVDVWPLLLVGASSVSILAFGFWAAHFVYPNSSSDNEENPKNSPANASKSRRNRRGSRASEEADDTEAYWILSAGVLGSMLLAVTFVFLLQDILDPRHYPGLILGSSAPIGIAMNYAMKADGY